MDFYIQSQIVVQTAAAWAADTTVYSEKRILITSDLLYSGTNQRRFKFADGVLAWSALNYVPAGSINPTSGVLPYNNAGSLGDSHLSQDANKIYIANSKTFSSLDGKSYIDLYNQANIVRTFLLGFSQLSAYDTGILLKYFADTNYGWLEINDAVAALRHTGMISLNAPIINLPQLAPSKMAVIDASSNMVAGAHAESDFELITNKGAASGYAPLNSSSKIDAAYLPSYVDDVLEYANYAALPGAGETGKIYITIDDNLQYRWTGTVYTAITASPGTTDDVPEGLTNLYFTVARVLAAVWDAFKIKFVNTAGTFTSFFVNANTAARTYTYPDKDGMVAMLSDIVPDGTSSWLDPVISNSITAPPAFVEGERYLLPAAGLSGAWVGSENKIAQSVSAAWVYTTPVAGNVVVVNSLSAPNNQFTYTGAYNTGAWTASSVVNAFTQGGNSFGGNAIIGTNDNKSFLIKVYNVIKATLDTSGNWSFLGNLGVGGAGAPTNAFIAMPASTASVAHQRYIAGVDVTSGLLNGMEWYNGSAKKFRDASITKTFVFDYDSRGIAKSAGWTVAATENGVTYNVTTGASALTCTYPTGVAGFVFYIRKVDTGAGVIITSVASITMTRQYQVAQFAYNGSTWDATIVDEGLIPTDSVMGNMSGVTDYAQEISTVDIHDVNQKAFNYAQNGFTFDWLSGVFFRQYRAKTVTGVTKTSILSTTAGDYIGATATPLRVFANSMTSGKVLRLKIRGKYTSISSVDTLLIEIKIGGVTLTSATPLAVNSIYTDDYFEIDYEIQIVDTGASGSVLGLGTFNIVQLGALAPYQLVSSFAAQTLDTTIDNDIVVNAQHSDASGSITNCSTTFERLA
ncbi:MAG: hypothetical protein A3F72_02900 [Bacteroidetes bacterium RIFCSPLOWO2_12_FULL_35_15]|nr:MAG: hypothetical protein A3F72_02900 [Bacteroidetes bacterium RIFCSPLOWO2_12_FULL_35_15]